MLHMPAATSSPTMATIRGRSRPISGIAIFRTRPLCRPDAGSGLRCSFGIEFGRDGRLEDGFGRSRDRTDRPFTDHRQLAKRWGQLGPAGSLAYSTSVGHFSKTAGAANAERNNKRREIFRACHDSGSSPVTVGTRQPFARSTRLWN